jgi:cyclopropane fatty-acyl-phospholipid synthase-like methyltransferase
MFAALSKWMQVLTTQPTLELSELAPDDVPVPPVGEVSAQQPVDTGPVLPDIDRLELLQKMWGKGFATPGTNEFYLSLTVGLQLNEQKNLVDLNAGLGGAARLIATEYKTYVTGFERDAAIAEEGMKISTGTGQGKRATVSYFDPKSFDYGKKADAIMACDLLYTIEDKDKMLANISKWLKPRGHLVMTDFVCDPSLSNAAIERWIAKEPYAAHPVSNDDMLKLFAKHGFDLRVNEDITKPYGREALMGLLRMVQWLEGKKLSRASKRLVAQTVDLWAARLTALDKGVKNMRYYAIKTN